MMSRIAATQSARMKYDHVAWLNGKGNQIKIIILDSMSDSRG